MALIEDVVGVRCCHCERSDAISSPVDAYHTVKTLPRRKAGAHPSSAQQADKWIPAFRRESALVAVPSRAGRPPGRWSTRNDEFSLALDQEAGSGAAQEHHATA